MYLAGQRGLTFKQKSPALTWGKAIHIGIADYVLTKDIIGAIKKSVDWFEVNGASEPPGRSIENLSVVLQAYTSWYAVDEFQTLVVTKEDGTKVSGLETNFELDLVVTPEVKVMLCGVVDAVGLQNGRIAFKDIKHTTSSNHAAYMDSYALSHQMMTYSWALKQIGFADHYPTCIIDAIFIKKSELGATFVRKAFTYSDVHVELWMKHVIGFAKMISGLTPDEFTHNFAQCQRRYGLCDFYYLCSTTDPDTRDQVEKMLFTTREYNPAEF